MIKSLLLTLLPALVFLQTSFAQDAYRVTIVKDDGEPKLTAEQIDQFKKAGIASPDDLPIVVCVAAHSQTTGGPSNTFRVVVENTQATEVKIAMDASAWNECLAFHLTDDTGAAYSISVQFVAPSANPVEEKTWAAHGTQIFPVSFCDQNWESHKAADDTKPQWPAPKQPVLARLTVSFTYWQNDKSITVTSKPTAVILMAK